MSGTSFRKALPISATTPNGLELGLLYFILHTSFNFVSVTFASFSFIHSSVIPSYVVCFSRGIVFWAFSVICALVIFLFLSFSLGFLWSFDPSTGQNILLMMPQGVRQRCCSSIVLDEVEVWNGSGVHVSQRAKERFFRVLYILSCQVEAHYWRCGVGPVFVFQLSQLHFLVLFCSFPSYILSFHSSLSVYLCKVLVLIWFDFFFFFFFFFPSCLNFFLAVYIIRLTNFP